MEAALDEFDAGTGTVLRSAHGAVMNVLAQIAVRPDDVATIFGASGDAWIAFDEQRRILVANAAAEALFGYSRGALDGCSTDVLLPPRLRQPSAPPMAAVTDVMQIDLPGQRLDGSELMVEWVFGSVAIGSATLFVMQVRDRSVADRALVALLETRLSLERAAREAAEDAERRVRAGEDRLRRLQQITAALSEAATPSEVAAVVLDQSLLALAASGGAVYTLAADQSALEILDQRGHSSLHEFSRIPLPLHAPLCDAVRDRTARFYDSFEACAELYPALREAIGDGGFEASVALPLITHGTVLGVLGIRFLDKRTFEPADRSLLLTLSELCAQALDRARLFDAERAANRSKDEFLAMLGHELRNPLAPIVTALNMMDLRDSGAQRERTVIQRQVTHLVRLVDDLLDVSRITQGKVQLRRERCELATIIDRAVELSSPLLESRGQHLAVTVPARGLAISGDPTRLAQVVSNLLSNAAKYTPTGGHIEVAARRELARIVLTVRDDGVGIAGEMLPRVFDLFAQERQSIDRSQGGLGLGLAIVKSLVALHGGTVMASSAGHGQGSTFTVEIPADADPAEVAPISRPVVAQAAVRLLRRVLVVDDNCDAAELLAELLRACGHTVEVAHDGPAALEVARSFGPDIALLDLGLPVMDGYELAGRLRELGSLRLVAVTGYGQLSDRQRTQAAGFDVHLVKPVALEALHTALG